MTSTTDRVAALKKALAANPDDNDLRYVLADILRQTGHGSEACDEFARLLGTGHVPPDELITIGELALREDRLDLAARCLNEALRAGVVDGTAALQSQLDAKYEEKGQIRVLLPTAGQAANEGKVVREDTPITFAQVGGLEAVKKTIHRLIILPMLRPDLYRRYGRTAGGGVMLYGPPGCGKTLLARATAGECRLPFLNVRIEEILDPYFGISEQKLHGAFQLARGNAPCVLFIDELDAFAYTRHRQQASTGRTLVDQLLQELDAIGAENSQLLILAATNVPWDVDDALLRPGRFDRRVFVPPPDEPARHQILQLHLAGLPTGQLDMDGLVTKTALFSGADLQALVRAATDDVIEDALSTGAEVPVSMPHLLSALSRLRPTTIDWLLTARNHVEFANQDGRYDEIRSLLGTREVQTALKRIK